MRYAWISIVLIAGLSACQRPEIQVIDVPKLGPELTGIVAKGPTDPRLTYLLPDGWTETAPGPMRLVQFSIPALGKKAELSVTSLAGDAGGLLSNINRWRGQIELAPIEEDELGSMVSTISVKNRQVQVVDLINSMTDKRVITAVITTDTDTWFFKLEGTSAQLNDVKSQWDAFIQSVEVK